MYTLAQINENTTAIFVQYCPDEVLAGSLYALGELVSSLEGHNRTLMGPIQATRGTLGALGALWIESSTPMEQGNYIFAIVAVLWATAFLVAILSPRSRDREREREREQEDPEQEDPEDRSK